MRGFTLLELVIASALTVVMGGAVAVLLIRSITTIQQGEESLQQMFLLERTAEKMGRELRNAVPSADSPWTGTQSEISFLLSAGPTVLTSVHYHLVPSEKGQTLVRDWQPFPATEGSPQTAALLRGVVNFSVLYGMIQKQDGRGLLRWSGVWSIPPTEPAVLPEIVQLRLESQDSKGRRYSVTREFLIPQGVLKESSG